MQSQSQYIIQYDKNVDSSEPPSLVDGIVELSTNMYGTDIIQVRTESNSNNEDNKFLLTSHISSNFAKVLFDDELSECMLDFSNRDYSKSKSKIKFDKQSASAYTNFKTNLTKMINTKNETNYYSNGRVWYIGEVLYEKDSNDNVINRIANGKGTLYYNGVKPHAKYKGEFENGEFDGAGEFYSYDGKLSISAKNISNSLPIDIGFLNINFNHNPESIKIDFLEVFKKLKLDKKAAREFVKSNDFVKDVAKLYWQNTEPIEKSIFRDYTTEDKHVEVWNQIQQLESKIEELTKLNQQVTKENLNQTKMLIGYATLTIVFVNILLALVVR